MTKDRSVRGKRPTIVPMSSSSSIINRSIFDDLNGKEIDDKEARKFKRSTSYDDWANSYEWDLLDMGYRLHEVATTLLMDNVENSKSEECFIIDIGCGTGFVGTSLRKKGFNGVLHGIDENETMLRVAERKSAYDDLFWQHVSPDEKIDIPDDAMYDGLACIASFGVDHIHPKMLPIFVNRVKSDGILVITAANHPREETDKELLEEEIDKLIESKTLYEVSFTKECYFTRGISSRATDMAATCQFYCFVKT